MSLNLDTSTLFAIVSDLFNAFWPIMAIVVGFPLAFGIIKWIGKSFKSAF